MSTASDRRAPGAARISFDAMVEVGGALGPSFEAQAVNLSEDGMHLRTAYLPEVGQPITCRFDAGAGLAVIAAGEVLWNEDMGDGGEFGIRFTNLDAESTVALQRILGMAEDGVLPKTPQGRKVRLHIEGLASPMRARVRDASGGNVTAFSELGFLQMGKPLELEDAATGDKRPASIDAVKVEIDQDSRIPQLVVSLRYEDEEAQAMAAPQHIPVVDETTGQDGIPEPHEMDDEPHDNEMAHTGEQSHDDDEPHAASAKMELDHAESEEESNKLKGALARTASKVTPALEAWMKRAKTTVALLAAKRRGGTGDDVEIPLRRMTAPPPDGALHATGRKVVRGEIGGEPKLDLGDAKPKMAFTKKKAAVVGAVGIATILAFVAMRKPAAPAPVATTTPAETAAPAAPPPAMPGAATPATPATPGAPGNEPMATGQAETMMPTDTVTSGKPGKVTPFGNGSVGTHANILKIKMDGMVEKIQGASQPTGFTVVIPGRKSLDAAAPLASKDPRIAAIRVANEPSGTELTVSFKDGVPNYQVRAKKDTLEIVLARQPAEAKVTHPGRKHPRHKRH